VSAAKQSSHRASLAPTLGLRAEEDGFVIVTQTGLQEEIPTMALLFSRSSRNQRPLGQRRRMMRPELEALEDRSVPSAGYQQLNLVGFQPGMGHFTDPNLNGWGMDFAPNGPFCVANTSTGVATFYDAQGKTTAPPVAIPAAAVDPPGTPGSPTGLVYNPTSDFVISENGKAAPALFLFDTLDGLICGWNRAVDPDHAIVMVDNSTENPFPASYTGLTITQNSQGQNVLYAADSGSGPTTSNNRIDMFDGGFHSLGSFTDANVASQYPGNTVFQVEAVNNKLLVTFGGFAPPFGGVVDIFDTHGTLLTPNHFAANAPGAGPLENPWGIVLAPADFGKFSNDLLIGNVEGPGNINAFDPATGAWLGQLAHPDGAPLAIPGLWDLTFGGGSKVNGRTNQLFFDAGPTTANFAGNGLFGTIFAAGGGDQPQRTNVGGNAAVSASVSTQSDELSGGQPAQPATLPRPGSVLPNSAATGTQPMLGSPFQGPVAPAAAPSGKDLPTGSASSGDLVTGLTHRRTLDQVFAGLDSSSLWYASQGDAVPAWML
jgi:uncharacterized protein (TIGR03118 family)